MSRGKTNPFFVQTGSPRTIDSRETAVYDLQDAIVHIFPPLTEFLILYWNDIAIPLSYKYDVGDYIVQFVEVIDHIVSKPSGSASETLASNSFHTRWEFSWDETIIRWEAKWILAGGDVDSLNKHCNTLEMERIEFLAEWRCVFEKIATSLEQSGVRVDNPVDIAAFQVLLSKLRDLPGSARLYTAH